MSEAPKTQMEYRFTCNNCGRMLIVNSTEGSEEAQHIAASVYAWWFEMGSNKPVCGRECAAAWNEKRGLARKARREALN
jgi:hypothetical protein